MTTNAAFQLASELYTSLYDDEFMSFMDVNEKKAVLCERDSYCAITGLPILKNTKVFPLDLGKNFNDQWSCFDLTLPYVRSDVAFCMTATAINKGFSSVISLSGVSKISKLNDFAKALVNPPEPPFSMCYGNAKQQHLLWRTPVNYSQEFFDVRVGKRVLSINLPEVKAAYEYTQSIFIEKGIYSDDKKQIPLYSPFLILGMESISLKNDTLGVIAPKIRNFLKENPDDKEVLQLVEACESYPFSTKWALSLLYALNK